MKNFKPQSDATECFTLLSRLFSDIKATPPNLSTLGTSQFLSPSSVSPRSSFGEDTNGTVSDAPSYSLPTTPLSSDTRHRFTNYNSNNNNNNSNSGNSSTSNSTPATPSPQKENDNNQHNNIIPNNLPLSPSNSTISVYSPESNNGSSTGLTNSNNSISPANSLSIPVPSLLNSWSQTVFS